MSIEAFFLPCVPDLRCASAILTPLQAGAYGVHQNMRNVHSTTYDSV